MTTTRTINFTLNGDPVTAQIGNHQHLVEVLQAHGLTGAHD
jgi:aerobic-type carbon monoxide dehydrogenase small subunit (CoxS/CutS family)